MNPHDIAAITREIMGDDPNIISCESTRDGILVRVHRFDDRSTLRRVFGTPIQYVEVLQENE